jgi:hypothetical protein
MSETDYYDHCGGNDLACNCPCVRALVHGMPFEEFQALPGKRQCEGCVAAEKMEKVEEGAMCICAEWDGRGRSVCGIECAMHPLNGKCPTCDLKTHGNRKCIACACRDGEYE